MSKTAFMCNDCGKEFGRWVGMCTACKGTDIKEMKIVNTKDKNAAKRSWVEQTSSEIKKNTEIRNEVNQSSRIQTGLQEFDRVLGGGLTVGSVVLVGGGPGVGKSTLLIQSVAYMSSNNQVLYITGEESLSQVVNRADRLKLNTDNMGFLSETNVEKIIEKSKEISAKILVVDSIQTIYTDSSSSVAGSPSQLRDSTGMLVSYAKANNISIFIIGHVNKEGDIAGPKILEHMVDTVLAFEGDEGGRYRMLRSTKNRFGQVNELGVFSMTETGLREEKNPSAIFLSSQVETAGSSIMVVREGTRSLLFEVQSLISPSYLENPILVPIGLNFQRVRMILAVLQKHGDIKLFGNDIYLNIVGGMQLSSSETSSDLPLAFALYSSNTDKILSKKVASFGELSLAGEIRPVQAGEDRIKEAQKHGMKYIIVPSQNTNDKMIEQYKEKIKIIPVKTIGEAITALEAIN